MFLSNEEICQLTKKHRYSAQIKELNHLGIEHKRRGDGSVLVLRSHVENVMGGNIQVTHHEKEFKPNWNAI